MSKVRIVTDSLADIPPDICQDLSIEVVPAVVIFGDKTYRDKVDLSDAEFYQLLRESDELPTTSQPPVGDFEEVYRALAEVTNHIISIHIPEEVSGTLAAAQSAAAAIGNADIEVIDSTQISMAEGWLTIRAARAAQAGQPMPTLLDLIQETIPRLRLFAVLDTLEYARRGGRIGRAEAMMGTMLRVKPLIAFRHSEIVPVENVRTLHRALDRLIELVSNWPSLEDIAVVHADAADVAAEVAERLSHLHPVEEILVTEAGPVLGTHAGPGAVGVACVVGSQ